MGSAQLPSLPLILVISQLRHSDSAVIKDASARNSWSLLCGVLTLAYYFTYS